MQDPLPASRSRCASEFRARPLATRFRPLKLFRLRLPDRSKGQLHLPGPRMASRCERPLLEPQLTPTVNEAICRFRSAARRARMIIGLSHVDARRFLPNRGPRPRARPPTKNATDLQGRVDARQRIQNYRGAVTPMGLFNPRDAVDARLGLILLRKASMSPLSRFSIPSLCKHEIGRTPRLVERIVRPAGRGAAS